MSSSDDIKEKINNGDLEGALNILDSFSSLFESNELENMKVNLIKSFIGKLIKDGKFDEAIRKIDIYKAKYWKYKEDFIKYESSAYFNLAKKENEEDKIDSALKHLEISSSLDSDNEQDQLLIIQILINKKNYMIKPYKELVKLKTIYQKKI